MLDRFFADATTRVCIEFQEASAQAYACARAWISGRDTYMPRVLAFQRDAAKLSAEARRRLECLIGEIHISG